VCPLSRKITFEEEEKKKNRSPHLLRHNMGWRYKTNLHTSALPSVHLGEEYAFATFFPPPLETIKRSQKLDKVTRLHANPAAACFLPPPFTFFS